jgi:hypothetical protein
MSVFMSMDVFFVTERFHAVMPAYGADKGGRAAPEWMTSHLHLAISAFDGRPRARPGPIRAEGSSGKSQLKAPAQFGDKKRHPCSLLFASSEALPSRKAQAQ